jgi:hypothetical protein
MNSRFVLAAVVVALCLSVPGAAMASGDDIASAGTMSVGQSVAGTVDPGGDPHDVWAVHLTEGEEVTITVLPGGSIDASGSARLLAPATPSLDKADAYGLIRSTIVNRTYIDSVGRWAFTPARTGVYFIWVAGTGGALSYDLTVMRTDNPPLASLDSDDMHGLSVGAGRHVGVVEARTDPNDIYAVRCYAGEAVDLRLRPINNIWNNGARLYVLDPSSGSIRSYTTWRRAKNADGSDVNEQLAWAKMPLNPDDIATIRFTPPVTTTYYLWVKATSIAGGFPYALDIEGRADPAPARTKAYLTRPSGPAATTRFRRFTAAGTVSRHETGSKAVAIKAYRYAGGWKLYRTYSTSLTRGPGSYSTYSTAISLPYRGRWALRAYHAADSLHVTTASALRYITVR